VVGSLPLTIGAGGACESPSNWRTLPSRPSRAAGVDTASTLMQQLSGLSE
jgi:hypothetical protein